jgi:hypothetical protein
MRLGTPRRALVAVALAAALLCTVGSSVPAPRVGVLLNHPSTGLDVLPRSSPSSTFSLTENGSSPAAVGLTWTQDTTGLFVNYTIFESPNATGPWTSVGVITTQSTTSFVPTGLSPGSIYYWEIVDNYKTLLGAAGSQNTSALETSLPGLAYLTSPGGTSTSVQLSWTNNASYGGLISFVSYQVVEKAGNGTPVVVWTGTDEAVRSTTITGLTSGASYSFYVNTTDCAANCSTATPTLSVTQSNTLPVGVLQALTVTIGAVSLEVTQGQSDYFTCTPFGGKDPYKFSWKYGSGPYVAGIGSESRTFTTLGHVKVICRVTDAEPATASSAITIIVQPPGVTPPAVPPLSPAEVLAVAAGAGAALALLFVERRRRSTEAATLALPTRWVPPTDPNKFVSNSKRCLRCGTPNLPIRRTCQTCGAFLPRSPGP